MLAERQLGSLRSRERLGVGCMQQRPIAMTSHQEADILLYTNHLCPFAHRARIALEELKLPFKEVIIDLASPRTPEYLAINPRGLVPSISFHGEIFTESAVVAGLLADAYPGQLVPVSNAPGGPQRRARIAFFADTFVTKFLSKTFKFRGGWTDDDVAAHVDAAVHEAVHELEPLLHDAAPFFGGSSSLTMAEVLTGSFAIRIVTLTRASVYPPQLASALAERAPRFWAWAQAVAVHPSILADYDEKKTIESALKSRQHHGRAGK